MNHDKMLCYLSMVPFFRFSRNRIHQAFSDSVSKTACRQVIKKTKLFRFVFTSKMANQLVNIVLLGTAFMIIAIAYQTTIMVSVLYYFEFDLCIVLRLLSFLLAKCIRRSEEWNSKWDWLSRQWLYQVSIFHTEVTFLWQEYRV